MNIYLIGLSIFCASGNKCTLCTNYFCWLNIMIFISSPKNTCICSFVSRIAAVQSSALAQIFCWFVTCKLRHKSSSAVCTGTQHGLVRQPCQAHPHICSTVSDSKSCFKRNSRCLMALPVLQAWVVLKPGQLHPWEAAWDLVVEIIKWLKQQVDKFISSLLQRSWWGL